MTVRIGSEAARRLATAGDAFALQVTHASDVGAAIGALRLARVDVLGLAAGAAAGGRSEGNAKPTVSSVVNAPGGPLFLVEGMTADPGVRRQVPALVVRRLEKAGVESALVEVPARGGVLDALDATSNAVVLRLFSRVRMGASRASIPADWLDIAAEWATADLGDLDTTRLRVLGVEFEVVASEVSAVLHECGLARTWCDAVNGDLTDRVRVASATFGRLPHLALAAGGPGVDGSGLVARFRLLQEVARELAADVAYGCIDFEPAFDGLALGLSPHGWHAQGGAAPNLVARELLDDRVPDAYPYQVLGPGHVARLRGTDLAYEALSDGHVEVTIDDPAMWLPWLATRDDAHAQGWDLLDRCLVTASDVDSLVAARLTDDDLDGHGATSFDTLPDLDHVVLERTAHLRRGARLTLLELVSWLNHEAHTDAPATVSPVLATYARWLASGADDPDRQALKAIAPRLLGTGPASSAEERARQWLATDWLVRVQAPAWLRAAGMTEAADRLESLASLTDDLELVRAVDVLGTAITIASRRLDITAAIVADERREVPDEMIVWHAWEHVSETTGYVAASEAATHGADAELTSATDLRVIECSRDPRVRDELDAARQSIGDAAWTAALHAVADEAWERGWRAADVAAQELSGFTVRVESARTANTVLERRSQSDDDDESALEVADRAARDLLTRAALTGGAVNGAHPWDAACQAARASDGGPQWAAASDEARRAVGEDAWVQAMADARNIVTEVLSDAPYQVARVVVAAVAREAASTAARAVALRATAVARASGADYAETEAAANEALQRIGISLQAQAVALLDRLIDIDVSRLHVSSGAVGGGEPSRSASRFGEMSPLEEPPPPTS